MIGAGQAGEGLGERGEAGKFKVWDRAGPFYPPNCYLSPGTRWQFRISGSKRNSQGGFASYCCKIPHFANDLALNVFRGKRQHHDVKSKYTPMAPLVAIPGLHPKGQTQPSGASRPNRQVRQVQYAVLRPTPFRHAHSV